MFSFKIDVQTLISSDKFEKIDNAEMSNGFTIRSIIPSHFSDLLFSKWIIKKDFEYMTEQQQNEALVKELAFVNLKFDSEYIHVIKKRH